MFYYLATPYSKYPGGIERAFVDACRNAAVLVRAGVPVFSPIAHTHPVAMHGEIDPMDLSVWLEADRTFMDASKGIIVCMMKGWEVSEGIKHEIEYFRKSGKPIINMWPGKIPDELE